MSTEGVACDRGDARGQQFKSVVMGPRLRGDDNQSSRHREAQSLAAARHIDGAKAGGGKAAAAAIALFVGLELALARAKLRGAAPIQSLVLDLDGAVVGIDGF